MIPIPIPMLTLFFSVSSRWPIGATQEKVQSLIPIHIPVPIPVPDPAPFPIKDTSSIPIPIKFAAQYPTAFTIPIPIPMLALLLIFFRVEPLAHQSSRRKGAVADSDSDSDYDCDVRWVLIKV